MPRFRDEWVIDRVLFDYVSGGACSCCGLQHFLPNGTSDLIAAISDLDTDQQRAEIASLAFHPWPANLRDQVWADRVRLRQKLKLDKKNFQSLWRNKERRQQFIEWCWKPETYQNYRRWFQLSRKEISDTVQEKYNIHSAFGVVLCAVVEQVAAFRLTEYPPDGRGSDEVEFERELTYDRRGGFTLPLLQEDGNAINPTVLNVWLRHMENTVGSPGTQLLLRKEPAPTAIPKSRRKNDSDGGSDEEDGDDNDDRGGDNDDPDGPGQKETAATTSFASDRRIVRLLIARTWAELLQSKFEEQERTDGSKNAEDGAEVK